MAVTVAQALARRLKAAGVKRVFGVPGGEVLDIIQALREAGVEFVLVRHEAAGAFMAGVSGRITGRPGACLATLGPGAANMVLGVASARLDRCPLLAITGSLPTSLPETHTHQRLDIGALYRPITKATWVLGPRAAVETVDRALALAAAQPWGPVHLSVPRDLARLPVEAGKAPEVPAACPMGDLTAGEVARLLSRARFPLAVVGLGADPEDAAAAAGFLERQAIPFVVTPQAKGLIDERHPMFCGVAGGMAADGVMVELLERADLVLGIGFEPSEVDQDWHQRLPVIWIQDAPHACRRSLPPRCLARRFAAVARELQEMLPAPPNWGWEAETPSRVRDSLAERLEVPFDASRRGRLSPVRVLRALRAALPEDAVMVTDVGAHKLLAGQAWRAFRPGTFFMSNGLSSMGFGLPAAIAASLELPGRPVVALIGDGGMAMMMQEVETAVRLAAPVTVVVLVDRCLALIRVSQERRGLDRAGVDFGDIGFSACARAMGAEGYAVQHEAELAPLLRRCAASGRPAVVEVPVDDGEYGRYL
ncbi:MAG: thiamine pyrophosphate-binding protein [Acetobacteraceae bacterium]|nr:thiamine pyrophosphate-binding protein [Acetobacteraceae bacterium]